MSGLAFKCDRETLSKALSFADRISGKPGFAARIGPPRMRLSLAGDDLTIRSAGHDKSAEVQMTVAGLGDGEVIVSSSLIASIVPKLDDGDVEVISSNDEVKVVCGSAKFALPNATEWGASWAPPADGDSATVEASVLSDAINRVIRATDKENPVLKGVLVEELDDGKVRLVATDTFRLAMRDVSAGESDDLFVGTDAHSVLLPGDLLDDFMRSAKEAGGDECEAHLTVEDQIATFEVGGFKVTGPLLEGSFPNYRAVIPDSAASTVRVDRDALERVVQRVCLVADGEKRKVELAASAKEGSLSVGASSPDFGEAEDKVECAVGGQPPTVLLPSEHLLQGLSSFDAGEVELSFKDDDPSSVVVIRHADDSDNQAYLVMPIVP